MCGSTTRSLLLLLISSYQIPSLISAQSTPVIGGLCDLGASEVQIGGKQTQFFLKCEANKESEEGKGVWVVKSRNAASPTAIPQPSTTLPPANTEPQQHPKQLRKQPNINNIICAQDLNAREADSCSVPATCLQLNNEEPSSFLQCDQSNSRWVKKSCSDGSVFSFEQQACIPSAKAPNRHYARYSTGSQGVVCTFTQCSNSNPCSQGTCNNGYCCTSGSSSSPIIQEKSEPYNKTLSEKTTDFALVSNDWPIGPPGFGFPPELANLDSILVKATGDGRVCAAGFISSLKCSSNGECPPGLFCDPALSLCCPLLLPITDKSNTADQLTHPKRLSQKSYGSYPISSSPSCPGCGTSTGGQVITIPSYSPSSGSSSSLCTAGCPRGYSGCCGTQQASCCLRQQCPGGLPSTGRSCYRSCPSGQVCVSGVCCPQLSCPSGGQPYGSCINGYCSPGYQCMQSTGMCCPVPAAQQSYVQVCPMGGSAMGSCVAGTCSQGYTCVKPINLCCPSSTTNPFVCPDGTQAVGACINGQCGTGFTCTNGLCCNGTSQSPRCLDGSQAVGACINGRCGAGYVCTTGNICCQSGATATCPNGQTQLGPCVNGLCPAGYTCINNVCCSTNLATFTCEASAARVGSCGINGQCAAGFSCDTSIDQCCPTAAVLDECVPDATGEGICPAGYVCYPESVAEANRLGATQMCYESCDGNAAAEMGPSRLGQCPPGSSDILGMCCQNVRLHRSPERKSALIASYSEPLPGVMNMNPVGTCPGGSPAVSGCMNGLCGSGFECINNLCCSYVARNAIIFAASATRPIGAACDYSEQCVGFTEGLSTCEIGNCRCLPIAYTQGIACVRRRALSLKFNDAIPVENVDSNSTTVAAITPATSLSTKAAEQQRPSES